MYIISIMLELVFSCETDDPVLSYDLRQACMNEWSTLPLVVYVKYTNRFNHQELTKD